MSTLYSLLLFVYAALLGATLLGLGLLAVISTNKQDRFVATAGFVFIIIIYFMVGFSILLT